MRVRKHRDPIPSFEEAKEKWDRLVPYGWLDVGGRSERRTVTVRPCIVFLGRRVYRILEVHTLVCP